MDNSGCSKNVNFSETGDEAVPVEFLHNMQLYIFTSNSTHGFHEFTSSVIVLILQRMYVGLNLNSYYPGHGPG